MKSTFRRLRGAAISGTAATVARPRGNSCGSSAFAHSNPGVSVTPGGRRPSRPLATPLAPATLEFADHASSSRKYNRSSQVFWPPAGSTESDPPPWRGHSSVCLYVTRSAARRSQNAGGRSMRLLAFNAAFCFLMTGAAAAQTAQTTRPISDAQSAYLGHQWTGLLVPAGCESGSKRAEDEAAITTSGRTTTPAIDESGTRGQAGEMDRTDRTHGRSESPRLGDVLNDNVKSTDSEWADARKQAKSLGAACRLTPGVDRFALVLPNGRVLPLDDAANVTVSKRVSGALPKATIIRVHVAGKLRDGKISVDTIQM